MKHAKGKRAWAISDRDGMRYPYDEMRTEWNGLRVHKSEFEPKHPSLTPPKVLERAGLKDARPGTNTREDATVFMRYGLTCFVRYEDITHGVSAVVPSGEAVTSAVGEEGISIVLPVSGEASAAAVGTAAGTSIVLPFGISTSVSLSDETPQAAAIVLGTSTVTSVGTAEASPQGWGQGAWSQGAWGE